MFNVVEEMHGARPWGSVLDAGTGTRSLPWIAGLPTKAWTALTASAGHAEALGQTVRQTKRPDDAIVVGNWTDPTLFAGRVFDVVIADYVLGAIENHAPYFQGRFIERLRTHTGARLYLTGLEPLAGPVSVGASMVEDILRMRDIYFLLSGLRPYREYPLDWVLHALPRANFKVIESRRVPRMVDGDWANRQINGCIDAFSKLSDRVVGGAFSDALKRLRERLRQHIDTEGPIAWTHDWYVAAEPTDRG